MSNAFISFGLTLLIVVLALVSLTYYPIIVAKVAMCILGFGVFCVMWEVTYDLVKDWRKGR